MFRKILAVCALALALSPPQAHLLAGTSAGEPVWAFEESDLAPDPAFVFGRLDNGLRFIIRHNATPPGQGLVRLHIDAGSLSEGESELGYAHFIEHMAFNGSTHVPEGEMIRLLEREGLAFGADTNAMTGFDLTLYMLDLPRNDPALLDTALMLMRETASELAFTPSAVERERGVVLSEKRVRDTFAYRNLVDSLAFLYPGSRLAGRLPIGEEAMLALADPDALRSLWDRLYTPANATLIVIGDFDPGEVRNLVARRFADWAAEPRHDPPPAGPIDPSLKGLEDIHIHPALPESVTISRHGPWIDRPDTVARRRQDVLRQIGYGIINRRLQSIARQQDAPFRSAQLDTSEVYRAGRTTSLTVMTGNGEWERGLLAAVTEYRRAMEAGFTKAEVAEQAANLRASVENAAASAETRSHAALAQLALALVQDRRVPATPQSALERFRAMEPLITPEGVLAALREELVPLDDPLIRFTGPAAPEGGGAALRRAWNRAMSTELAARPQGETPPFAYTDFGPAGAIVADATEPLFGIRTIRFANGLRLNLKPTDLQRDRVLVQLNIDGGDLLNTKENPLATALVGGLPVGGLGRHSQDELQSILAGRTVGLAIEADEDSFRSAAGTTPRDLELQLQLLAALVSDPGYRTEGEIQFRRNIADFFARLDATPALALNSARGGILSDNDPRFTLQRQEDYLALDFARLRRDISDRLAHGAMELALVGDFDPETAIALVARTLGALPQREGDFLPHAENRTRSFTADRSSRVIRHNGEASQALIEMTWPTRDDSDPVESARLQLLQRMATVALTDRLREELGKTYSPSADAGQSRVYPGYGTFAIRAEVDVADVDAVRGTMLAVISGLANAPIDADLMQRARQPLLEAIDNALKTNGGWMNLVARAQSRGERIERFSRARQTVLAITAEDIRETARRYLDPAQRVEILVLPRIPEASGEE